MFRVGLAGLLSRPGAIGAASFRHIQGAAIHWLMMGHGLADCRSLHSVASHRDPSGLGWPRAPGTGRRQLTSPVARSRAVRRGLRQAFACLDC